MGANKGIRTAMIGTLVGMAMVGAGAIYKKHARENPNSIVTEYGHRLEDLAEHNLGGNVRFGAGKLVAYAGIVLAGFSLIPGFIGMYLEDRKRKKD